jgi:hypothetical protein
MDTETPHRPRDWRGFAVELGTIVLGILIALGLQQLVETLHERQATAEARAAVREEIATDLAFMQQRRGEEACIRQRLAEVGDILAAAREGRPYPTPQWVGRVINRPISQRRWTAASQSGRVSLFSAHEQATYNLVYFAIDKYADVQDEEQRTWAELRTVEGARTLPVETAWRLTGVLNQARLEDYRERRGADRAFDEVRPLAIRASPAHRRAPDLKVQPTCVPIGTDRATALAMIANPTGEP